MPIYTADLPAVHAASYLWAVPALPAAAAALLALAGLPLQRRFGRAGITGTLSVAVGAAAGILLAAVGVLAWLPAGARLIVDARGQLVEAAPVTISATLALDPLRAALALAVTFVCGAAAWLGLARVPRGALRRASASLAVCAAAALVLVLADDALLALVAWEALVWGALGLAAVGPHATGEDHDLRARGAEALVVNRVAQASWLAAIVLLFWALADGPRVVTADVRGQGAAGADIELRTLGDRAPAASIRQLAVGPSLAPREIARQLALRDPSERRPFEESLAAHRVGPLPLVPLCCGCILAGAVGLLAAALLALGRARASGQDGAPPRPLAAAAAVMCVVAAVALATPFGFLFALSVPAAVVAVALALGAAAAIVAPGVRGRVLGGVRRAFRDLGVLPANDFARAAAWLEGRVLPAAGGVLAAAALVLAAILLVRG